jgi:CcmD family protein
MTALIVAYSVVGLAVGLYLARFVVNQRRLEKRLEELQAQCEQCERTRKTESKAA